MGRRPPPLTGNGRPGPAVDGAGRIRWICAFADRPVRDFGPACDFWTAVTDTRLSELRGDQGEFVDVEFISFRKE